MLGMMTASGVASLMTGGLLGTFLGFFGIGSPMDKLSRRAPMIFGSIRSLSKSLQEQMKTVDLGHAAAQIGMFATVMSSLAIGMRDYEKVAIMAERQSRWGMIEVEPMMENVSRIRDALKVELNTMGGKTAEELEVTEAGEDSTTLGDVVDALDKIQKTLVSYAEQHEDDELTGLVSNLGWGGNT